MKARFIPLVVMLVLCVAMTAALFRHQPPSVIKNMIGATLTPPSLPMLDEDISFDASLWKGRVVLINVFASWCAPCIAEHPALMKLAARKEIDVIGLAWRDSPENVRAWIKKHGNPYTHIGVDEHGKATVALGLSGVPETFLLNKDGTVAYHLRAALTEDEIRRELLPKIMDRIRDE